MRRLVGSSDVDRQACDNILSSFCSLEAGHTKSARHYIYSPHFRVRSHRQNCIRYGVIGHTPSATLTSAFTCPTDLVQRDQHRDTVRFWCTPLIKALLTAFQANFTRD